MAPFSLPVLPTPEFSASLSCQPRGKFVPSGSPSNDLCPPTLVPRFSDSPEQKGWQAQVTEFKALWQATEVERDRLTEFVTVLQKR